MKKSAALIIDNGKGQILLQKRDTKPGINYPGQWATFGGALEDIDYAGTNDTVQAARNAAVREIKEELDYAAKDIEFFRMFIYMSEEIYVFRQLDPDVRPEILNVLEGAGARLFSKEDLSGKYQFGFNCREIAEAFFRRYYGER